MASERLPHETIGDEIRKLCNTYGKHTAEFIDAVGRRLVDAKKAFCQKGGWGRWLEENTDLDRSVADRIVTKYETRQLLASVATRLPENDAQYDALGKLKSPNDVVKVWKKLEKREQPLTAKVIRKEVAAISKPKMAPPAQHPPQPATKARTAASVESKKSPPGHSEDDETSSDAAVDQPAGLDGVSEIVVFGKLIKMIQAQSEDVQEYLWDMLSHEAEVIERIVPPNVATADELISRTAGMMQCLSAAETKKARADLVEIYCDVSDKPKDYLPSLPDDHEAAVKQVVSEVKLRSKQLKTNYAGWDNGKAGFGREFVKCLTSQATSFKKATGIDAKPAAPQLIDTTWPEHLDTEAVKAGWELYKADRKASRGNMGTDVLQDRIDELSQYEESVVVQILKDARNGKNGAWTGFSHDGMERYTKTRHKSGRVLSAKVNGELFADVHAFCKTRLLSQDYTKDMSRQFGEKVTAAVKSVTLKRMQSGSPEVQELFHKAMGDA